MICVWCYFHFKAGNMTGSTCVMLVIVVTSVLSLQLIPERAYVKYINEKYANGTKFYIRRHSRRSQYYINLEGWVLQEWGNNVSAHFYFYEFLHNEYKRSFVELHFKELCEWIKTSPYIGKALRETGCYDFEEKKRQGLPYQDNCVRNVKCPFSAGYVQMNNISIPAHNFPNVWPFERFRVDWIFRTVPGDELMVEIQLYAHVKQNIGK